jgi:ParB family chromosome partitioning protein
MGRLEELRARANANVVESMGGTRLHGATAAVNNAPPAPGVDMPARLRGVSKARNAVEIPLEKIDRDPNQPREEFDDESLHRLAASLRAKGQLQPIRVRWEEGQGVYLIVCGERRWRAARMAGLATLSAVVMEGAIDAGELLAVQLVENCLREDLRPIEQARAFRALLDRNGWSVRRLADELAMDHSNVVRSLALLDLPPAVQGHVEQGALSPTTAYEISKVDDPAVQEEIGVRAAVEGLTGAAVKEQIRARRDPRPRPVRVEYLATNGALVSVTMPGDKGDAFAIEALAQVLRDLKKRSAVSFQRSAG